MRTLQNTDIFSLGRILSKANLKEEIKNIATDKNTTPESLGFDLLFTLFTKCSDKQVEEEIYEFLASIFEVDAEYIKKMDPIVTMEKLQEVADWERWKDFFSLGAKLVK